MAESQLAEEFLPVFDVSGAVATVVEGDRGTSWEALLDVDLLKLGRETPLVGMLGALRMLPEVVGHLLHGERPAEPPESMRLRDLPTIPMYEGGWILLGERPGEEIALGSRRAARSGGRHRAVRVEGRESKHGYCLRFCDAGGGTRAPDTRIMILRRPLRRSLDVRRFACISVASRGSRRGQTCGDLRGLCCLAVV